MGEEHLPNPGFALAEDLVGALHAHFPYQGHGEGLGFLGQVLAAPLPKR
jgi:hypothetical protein